MGLEINGKNLERRGKLDKLTETVMNGLEPYLTGGYALTGSSAYRVLLPQLKYRPCKDTDLVVYPTQGTETLVDKNITDKFYVTRLFSTKRGLQFSLVHKDTGSWVDIFPRKQIPRFVEVALEDGSKVKLHTVEEIVYGLCIGILEKTYSRRTVLPDSLEKLKQLIPYVDLKLFDNIVLENIDQTSYMTQTFGDSINTRSMIEYIVKNCHSHTPPGYHFEDYPTDQIIAPNGLQVENLSTYKLAMEQHLRYLAHYKESTNTT